MKLPERKQIRLPDYDYSKEGAYFITICTKDRQMLLWTTAVGTPMGRPPLSEYGLVVEKAINNIQNIYPVASVHKYVIMPNHIHLIIMMSADSGRPMVVPTISRIINQFKGYVSKQVGFSVWQSRFYEHIIRNEQDYLEISEYIDYNPLRWNQDKYY